MSIVKLVIFLFSIRLLAVWLLFLVFSEESTLTNELIDHLLSWVAICNIIVDQHEFLDDVFISSNKHCIVDLSKTDFTQDFLTLRSSCVIPLDPKHQEKTVLLHSILWVGGGLVVLKAFLSSGFFRERNFGFISFVVYIVSLLLHVVRNKNLWHEDIGSSLFLLHHFLLSALFKFCLGANIYSSPLVHVISLPLFEKSLLGVGEFLHL